MERRETGSFAGDDGIGAALASLRGDVLAGAEHFGKAHAVFRHGDGLDGNHHVRAFGARRAGHDGDRFPAAQGTGVVRACRGLPHDNGIASRVGEAHGVAIHHRAVEGRAVPVGGDVLGQHGAQRFAYGYAQRGYHFRRGQHAIPRFLGTDHSFHGAFPDFCLAHSVQSTHATPPSS